jgi:hypothetical protein
MTRDWKNRHAPLDHDVNKRRAELCSKRSGGHCEFFLSAHAPTIGPEGPVPPFVASLDAFKVSAASPARLDSAGDSLVVAEMGAAYPNTFGTFIPDTISAVITAPEGTVLEYVCAIHPWMNGEIQVLKNSES